MFRWVIAEVHDQINEGVQEAQPDGTVRDMEAVPPDRMSYVS